MKRLTIDEDRHKHKLTEDADDTDDEDNTNTKRNDWEHDSDIDSEYITTDDTTQDSPDNMTVSPTSVDKDEGGKTDAHTEFINMTNTEDITELLKHNIDDHDYEQDADNNTNELNTSTDVLDAIKLKRNQDESNRNKTSFVGTDQTSNIRILSIREKTKRNTAKKQKTRTKRNTPTKGTPDETPIHFDIDENTHSTSTPKQNTLTDDEEKEERKEEIDKVEVDVRNKEEKDEIEEGEIVEEEEHKKQGVEKARTNRQDDTTNIHMEQTQNVDKRLYSNVLRTNINAKPATVNTQTGQNSTNIQTPRKTKPPRKVIIDNIYTALSQTQIIKTIYNIHKGHIHQIKPLKRGGLVLTPLTHADVNRLLKPQHYPQNVFGPNIYLHLPEEITDTRPWLCINQVPYDENNEDKTLNTIKDKLTEIKIETLGTNIEIEALHRKITHLPSTLILFKTTDKIQENTLLDTK